jgi:lipid-binding SYLF domain-containing protein
LLVLTCQSYVVHELSGPDQFGCATLAEAIDLARSYARHANVDVWSGDGPTDGFTLMARFRGSRRHTPQPAGLFPPGQRPLMKSALSRCLSLTLCVVSGSTAFGAASREQSLLEDAGVVMQEILSIPGNIPAPLLEKAECVIVIRSVTKIARGVGGNYGRGAMVCRTNKTFNGPWSAPAMYSLEGASFGLQFGGESTDVVLLVMNTRGLDALLNSQVQLGAGASAAAGPKGRNADASRGTTVRAEILSYLRARGQFAGVSLTGTSLRPDDDASERVYGCKVTAREIVTGNAIRVPASGRHFVHVLEESATRNKWRNTASR